MVRVSTVSWRIRQRSRISKRPKTSRVIENPAPETFHGDYHGNKENFSYCGRAHFFQAEDRQEKIPGCRTSAGASATRGGGMVEATSSFFSFHLLFYYESSAPPPILLGKFY